MNDNGQQNITATSPGLQVFIQIYLIKQQNLTFLMRHRGWSSKTIPTNLPVIASGFLAFFSFFLLFLKSKH